MHQQTRFKTDFKKKKQVDERYVQYHFVKIKTQIPHPIWVLRLWRHRHTSSKSISKGMKYYTREPQGSYHLR